MNENISNQKITKRLDEITSNLKGTNDWAELLVFGEDLHNELKGVEVFKKLEINPVNMVTGSISIYLNTFPANVFLRLWKVDQTYYLAFFTKSNDFFEVQLNRTFNEEGVMPLEDLDEAEARILDFVANEIYSYQHTHILD